MANDDLPPGMKPISMDDSLPAGMVPVSSTVPPNPSAPRPGFFSRTAEALGIPTSMDDLKGMGQATATGIVYPPLLAGQALKGIWDKTTQPMTPQEQTDFAKHPVGQVINQGMKRLLEGPLSPVGGQAVSNIANDVGNVPAQAGDVVGTIGNLLMFKGAQEPKTAARIAYATGGKAKDVIAAENDLRQTLAANPPKNVQDLKTGIDQAKSNLNQEYGNAIGPHANISIMPDAIVRRLMDLITPNLDMTAPGKAIKKQIKSAATEFQKPWTLAQLDQERMDANGRLHAFENKDPVAQYAATRGGNRSSAIDSAIAGGVRDTVYPMMDQLAGKPAGYFANLKNRVAALMNLSSDATKHIDNLETKSLQMQGMSPLERMRMRGMVGESGKPRLYMTDVLGKSDPLDMANSRAAGAFPGKLTSAARAAALVGALRRAAPNHPLVQEQEK